jgi:hypothetical protein
MEMNSPNHYTILSLDGGGIRGLLTVCLLEKLEQRVPGFIESVHLFGGTSTGGIIALALANGIELEILRDLYEQKGSVIFNRTIARRLRSADGVLAARYDNEPLELMLKEMFGESKKLGDLQKAVVVPTFDLYDEEWKSWKPKIFHNFLERAESPGGKEDRDVPVYKVALYTSAAPTYFPSIDGFVDGGVFANNPAMVTLGQARDSRKIEPIPPLESIRLLSVGTGAKLIGIKTKVNDWGYLQWGSRLIDLLMDGVAGIADYQCAQLLGDRGYHRLGIALPEDIDIAMDDVEKIPQLLRFANSEEAQKALEETTTWLRDNWIETERVS